MKRVVALMLGVWVMSHVRAASFSFDAAGSEPLYQTTLTKEVYQTSHRDNLEDITIHNTAGEQLPYALVPYESLHTTQMVGESIPLVIFPIQADASKTNNDINIHLEQNIHQTTIDVVTKQKPMQAQTAYLFDLGKAHPTINKLKVDWQGEVDLQGKVDLQSAEGKLISVEVFSSNNLKDWRKIGQSVLIKSVSAGQIILQNTIDLYADTEDRYLQIRPAARNSADFILSNASIEYNKVKNMPVPLLWEALKPLRRNQANNAIHIDFEAQGRYPASHLRISLPQPNTITSVQVLTRNKTDAPWDSLTRASLYRLNKQGRDTVNPDINIHQKVARYWRLQFNQTSGGIGPKNPTLSVGWLPKTVVWNARGKAPFTLQIAESSAATSLVSISNLMPNYRPKMIHTLPIAHLILVQAKKPSASTWDYAPDYKRWLLWTGLGLGVLLLAGMAYSLLKTTQKK